MNDFASLLQQGNAWLFVPSAILLGALHGLEPGHSKTMMAAFIVAIRGTLKQAILLGLAATLSHTAVVWIIAMAGLWFGRGWDAHTSEPWFQLISGVLIIAIALWMAWRTWKESQPHEHHHHHDHDHITMTAITITTTTTTTTTTIIMIITTMVINWLKKSGKTPTSARMPRILTVVSTDKTSLPGRSPCLA